MTNKKNINTNNSSNTIQNKFIDKLKQVLPPSIGLAEEIADILGVSIDSAYRRMRGETELTIEELYAISKKHNIGIDEVFGNKNETVTFTYTKLTDSEKNFETYLNRITNHMVAVNRFTNKKIVYVAEDIPMFYSFISRKLTEFKLFYWQRSVLNIADYQNTKFDWGIVPQKMIDTAHSAYKEYLKIPSTEIWTQETVFTGLRQIKFYFDSGIIKQQHALELIDEYKTMIELVQKNAETGRKNSSDPEETFFLYSREVALGTNCIYIKEGDLNYSYIAFNSMNSLTTNNPEFCDETEHWIRNLEKKSTLISGVSEKQRYQFFNKLFANINEYADKINNS